MAVRRRRVAGGTGVDPGEPGHHPGIGEASEVEQAKGVGGVEQQQRPDRHQQGADRHEDARPVASSPSARARAEQDHQDRDGKAREARLGGLQARALLQQAGWTVQGGVLRNAQGQALELEYLDSNEGGLRVVAPWQRNLEKLGIRLRYRAVDFALYQQRLQKFDFDITSIAYQGTNNPGQELADLFGSQAADQEDSGNFPGVKNPAVDALIDKIVTARTQDELLPACHALERVIAHGHYLIPQWYASTHRMAYNAWRLAMPSVLPPYSTGEDWVLQTWWSKKQ